MAYSWHQDILLQTLQRRDNLPHAQLIIGTAGIGKRLFANTLAKALLCRRPQANGIACGHCHSCGVWQAHSHPDFFLLGLQQNEQGKPAKDIKIDQVRELIQQLAQTPQLSERKIAIITPAERLNRNAANSLLKTLEEPTPDTFLFLLTASPGALPATIRSRCQQLKLPTPTPAQISSWLTTQQLQQPAEILLAAANGLPERILELNADLLAQRQQVFKQLMSAEQQPNPVKIANDWKSVPLDWLFAWISSGLEDITKLYYSQSAEIINTDLRPVLLDLVQKLPESETLFAIYNQLRQAQQWQQTGVNMPLFWSAWLIAWFNFVFGKSYK